MKTAGIICSGLSVKGYLARPVAHDVTLGVNRMAQVTPCDWWVFNDHEVFYWWPAITKDGKLPRVFTSNQSFKLIAESPQADHERIGQFRWMFHPQIETDCPSDAGWINFSMLIAMVLCRYLGVEKIFIYGCDWDGDPDWDGEPSKRGTRHADRWNDEIHKYGLVTAWLKTKGVSVVRVGHEESEMTEKATKRRSDEATKEERSDGATKGEKAAGKFKAFTVTMEMKRDYKLSGGEVVLPAGTPVAEVTLLTPEIGLNYITRAHVDGIVGPIKG